MNSKEEKVRYVIQALSDLGPQSHYFKKNTVAGSWYHALQEEPVPPYTEKGCEGL
jgi:hypothetical protein